MCSPDLLRGMRDTGRSGSRPERSDWYSCVWFRVCSVALWLDLSLQKSLIRASSMTPGV